MLRIPSELEQKLSERFPKIREREKFVKQVLEDALLSAETASNEDMPESVGGTLHLFSDGGSRGNPGQAAIGYILEDPHNGVVLKEYKDRIGVETNNVAEYRALIEGLKAALKFQPNRLICHLDSELVVKQLNGEYKVKMQTLQTFVDEIKELEQQLSDVVYAHIPRGDNYRADALVNKALDEMPEPTAFKAAPLSKDQKTNTPEPLKRPGDAYRASVRQERMF